MIRLSGELHAVLHEKKSAFFTKEAATKPPSHTATYNSFDTTFNVDHDEFFCISSPHSSSIVILLVRVIV